MANKRETSSQRRQRENRARRAALEARTKGAPPARPSRVAPSTAEKLKARAADTDSSTKGSAAKGSGRGAAAEPATGKGRGAKGGRPKRERPPRPGDRPVDVTTLEGSWFNRIMQVPGGTQAMVAALATVVFTGIFIFTASFVSQADIDADVEKPELTQTLFERFDVGPALALVGVPLLLAAVATGSSFRPQRRRIWFFTALALGFGFGLVLQLQYYLLVAGFYGYACYRASKVEGPQTPLLQVLRRRLFGSKDAATDGDATPESSSEA